MRQAANFNVTVRDIRLDPMSLPVRFQAPVAGPSRPALASILLDRDRVVMKRPLGGVDATVTCPLKAFRGVAVRMTVDPETDGIRTVVELMHRDPAMTLPLVSREDLGDAEDVAADWQAWGKALGLPLLIVEGDGTVREAMSQMGGLVVGEVKARRMVSSLTKRRPRFLKRRKTGLAGDRGQVVGREIIARD
jgi:hypothetical protein